MPINIEISRPMENQLRGRAKEVGKSLDQFIIDILQDELRESKISDRETFLLQQIGLGIPLAKWKRYNQLIDLRNKEILSIDQQKDLIALSNEIEQRNAERMPYVFELAQLRGIKPETLIRELGIQ
ncbi:MAG: hypothetical protein AAF847_15130 [Bacteroidota bacterium]